MEVGGLKRLKGIRNVVMLTAYDYQMAKILDKAGLDLILVGDSLGMVVLGFKDTKKVSMEDMVRHTEAVSRGVKSTLMVSDMPKGSYNRVEDALKNAGRLIDAGADAVKIEGNKPEIVKALTSTGIEVMGHVGLLPQEAEEYRVKGKSKDEAERIYQDAVELDGLGVFSIVLECIPSDLAKTITETVGSLTIGIGAGPHCDGQVLVLNDMLGLEEAFKPKHVKRYAQLNETVGSIVQEFIKDVQSGKFPTDKHSFH